MNKIKGSTPKIKELRIRYHILINCGADIAIILSFLECKELQSKESLSLTRDGYFYTRYEHIAVSCNLNIEKVKKHVRFLEKEGYIKTRFSRLDGINAKHYKIDFDFIYNQEGYCEEELKEKEMLLVERRNKYIRNSKDRKMNIPVPFLVSHKTYLMIDEHTMLVKIGKSVCPVQRESTLCSQEPKLKLLFVTNKNIESQLHTKYSHKRHRGEWFKLSLEEVVKIADDYGFEAVY